MHHFKLSEKVKSYFKWCFLGFERLAVEFHSDRWSQVKCRFDLIVITVPKALSLEPLHNVTRGGGEV